MHLAHAFGPLALLLFTACQANEHRNTEIGKPVDQEHQAIALQGTTQLREQWNRGDCQVVYEQAATRFHSQSLQDWLSQCVHLREKLGLWQSFAPREAIACGERASIVCLDGIAVFGGKRFDMIVAWMLENRQPHLLYLSLGQNNKTMEAIPPPRQRLLDAPPRSNPTTHGDPYFRRFASSG